MKTHHPASFSHLFRLARFFEGLAARIQGKGYGTSTVNVEVALAIKLLGMPPKLAIDIGGNIGDYTAQIRKRSPLAEIHTFEPSVVNIKKLRARFSHDDRIFLVPLAVSNQNGPATLYSNESGSGLASLSQRNLEHFHMDFSIKEDVETVRFLDYWTDTLNRKTLDIVKLDIEGHEFSALNGFGEAIDATRIIQFEFGGCNIDTRTFFQDFWYFFKNRNFDMYRITPLGVEYMSRYREIDEYFSTTNYIAVNRHHLT